jgi:hypothetical protein
METGSTNPPPSESPARLVWDRRLIAAGLLLFALGWFTGQGNGNPFAPKKPERPVLTFIAKIAKAGLWLLVVEPVPDDLPPEDRLARIGRNTINHKEGW